MLRCKRAWADTHWLHWKTDFCPPVALTVLTGIGVYWAEHSNEHFKMSYVTLPVLVALGGFIAFWFLLNAGEFLWNFLLAGERLAVERANHLSAALSIDKARVAELEDATRPRLAIQFGRQAGFPLHDRGTLLFLEVRNTHGGQIRNAYAKVRMTEHGPAHGGALAYHRRLYRHQDVFLKWSATTERCHTFETNAVLQVAAGRAGDGGYKLCSLDEGLTPGLRTGVVYEVLLEIASDNAPLLVKRLHLRMDPYMTKEPDGATTWWPDLPLQSDFRLWATSDGFIDEMDMDEWEKEHMS